MESCSLQGGLRPLIERLNSLDRPATIAELRQWLEALEISRDDVAGFVRFNDACYARNPVVATEHFELLCICWKSGQSSLIHDHIGSACGVRIVDGELTETIFDLVDGAFARPRKVNQFQNGFVCSSVDKDVHQITNHQTEGRELITLHVYSPPLATMNSYIEIEPHQLQESAPV